VTVTSPVANLQNSSSSRSKQVIVAVLGIVEGCRAILALLLLHFGGAGNSMQYMESSPSRYRWIITNQPSGTRSLPFFWAKIVQARRQHAQT
jgi:hypothetical protein